MRNMKRFTFEGNFTVNIDIYISGGDDPRDLLGALNAFCESVFSCCDRRTVDYRILEPGENPGQWKGRESGRFRASAFGVGENDAEAMEDAKNMLRQYMSAAEIEFDE